MLEKFGFRGLYETMEEDSAVSMKPLSGFSFLNTTAEADSAVYMRPWNPL
jgi:hypothetical protein